MGNQRGDWLSKVREGALLKVILENFVTCFVGSTASLSLEMLLEGPWMGLTEDFLVHLQGNCDSKPCFAA